MLQKTCLTIAALSLVTLPAMANDITERVAATAEAGWDSISAASLNADTLPVLKVGTLSSEGEPAAPASLFAHNFDGKDAATIYFRELPIVTLISTAEHPNPLARAASLTAELNVLGRQSASEPDITLELRADSYTIMVNDAPLLALDGGVLHESSAGNTALLAVNRLRRLVAAAPPLETLPGGRPTQQLAVASRDFTGWEQSGLASWYGAEFAGSPQANGIPFDPNRLTAAHPSLPFGTEVAVTNVSTGESVVVEITDRGPHIGNRIIDLSAAAARAIGVWSLGVAPVRVQVVR